MIVVSRWVSLIAVVLVCLIWVGGTQAQTEVKSRVIITFKDTPTVSDALKVSLVGGEVTDRFQIVPSLVAEVSASAMERLRADPRVVAVEADHRVRISDAELDSAWGVKHIGAGLVHPTNQGAGVKVAVLTRHVDRYPWVVRVTATNGDLTASKTCTYKGLGLSCQ
jgi:hypothetical protein